ncbi:MAG: hypothetical protein IJR82_02920 [Bacilli bacterium]|nr:hypothetical protein [Bacilli bacterium]
MKEKERIIDLSDIKEDELDKTASFTDLMSRSERRKRRKEKEKQENDVEITEINTKENLETNISKENLENVSEIEQIEEYLNKTEKFEHLTKDIEEELNVVETETDNLFDDTDNNSDSLSGMLIASGIFLIISTFIFLYIMLFTEYLSNQTFLYIDIIVLMGMYFIFSISIIANRKGGKILSLINYLSFLFFTVFNTLLLLNYIK